MWTKISSKVHILSKQKIPSPSLSFPNMGDQPQDISPRSNQNRETDQKSEPVRSRWTPKPEQILILESIFNSGMVNPPKDETVRIRKLLEKFGAVGDANVFYWFQNRRSRSRRRQRQIQAASEEHRAGAIQSDNNTSLGFSSNLMSNYPVNSTTTSMVGSGSSSNYAVGGGNDGATSGQFFSFSGHPGIHELNQALAYGFSDNSSLHYHAGLITVFINGVATEVGRGPVDIKAMFGSDFVLFHSSGVPVQVNEFGFLMQGLQHGESYFLVPRNS